MTASDTIAAISTPPGEGAIALVRISGANAIQTADKIFRGKEQPSKFASHVQHLGEIFSAENRLIDQALVSVHRAPASYTGEDLVEISCHGGTLVSAKVLEACLRAGARAARPGEFTERAFLNGKMDLTQAEAVIDLIRARTDLALRSATEQLEGGLGDQIRKIRDELIALLAHINASIDFPEEGIEPDEDKTLCARLDAVRDEIGVLLATADQGRVLREGVRVVIYGATNVGKSSLLNRLLGYDRVIVSDTHGTTRDTIEETANLEGLPIRLLDTAGLRASESELEREGIERTQKSLQLADLRLHIADRNSPKPVHFSGAMSDPNLKAMIDLKLEAAKRDKRVSMFKAEEAVKAVPLDEGTRKKLEEVSDVQLKAKGTIKRPTALLIDKSGSMELAIDIGKRIGAMISAICESELFVYAFDKMAYPITPVSSTKPPARSRSNPSTTYTGRMKCSQKTKSISSCAQPTATSSTQTKCSPPSRKPRTNPVRLTPNMDWGSDARS